MPYDKNPRRNDKAVDAVATSIQDFGFKVPIIVDKDGVIVAGHTRLKAAAKLGMDEVPVVVADDLTPEQIKAFRLADNRVGEIATWDEDGLASELEALSEMGVNMFDYGFKEADFAAFDDIDDELEPEAEEIETRTAPGEVWLLGRHRLIVGDATNKKDIERLVGGQEIDLLMTDPPYGVSYEGGTDEKLTIENDDLDSASLLPFLSKAFKAADGVMRPGASFYIWYASSTMLSFLGAVNNTNWEVKQHLMWIKNTMTLGRQDYQWQHEPCLYGWKPGKHFFSFDRTSTTVFDDEKKALNKMNKKQLKNLVLRLQNEQKPTDVIREDKPLRNADHPTMKPIRLISRLVANSTGRNDNVLDPFAGSGSTLLACELLGRVCYAAELDPRYADVIIKRWEVMAGGQARRAA